MLSEGSSHTLPHATAVTPIVLAPIEVAPHRQFPDTYWGVHPFLSTQPEQSGVAQWYATSNSSLADLRPAGHAGREDDACSTNEWPTLSGTEHPPVRR